MLRKLFTFLVIGTVLSSFAYAQPSVGKVVTTVQVNGTLLISGEQGQMLLSTMPDATLKVRIDPGTPDAEAASRSVVGRPSMKGRWELGGGEEALTASKDGWQVIVQRATSQTWFVYQGDTLLSETAPVRSNPNAEGINYATLAFATEADERFFGAGPRAIPQNLRGQRLEVYNQPHYGYANGTANLNITIPWVVSSEGYGVYVDSELPGIIDLGATSGGEWSYTLERAEDFTYYIVAGALAELPHRYAQLTGYQTMPPRWALGFIQSRYGYETEAQARNVVDSLRIAGFPLDALVLDLQWFGDKENMGHLDWDRQRFPTPEKMMADFAGAGVKTIAILEPYFTKQSTHFDYVAEQGWFAKDASGNPFIIEDFWTGGGGVGLLDLYQPATHDWFWDFYKDRTDEGVAAWWCDLGEPETHPEGMIHANGVARESHNGFSLIWARMLHERWQKAYPERRMFNLIRSGYGGMQRYGTFPWSGDISRSWSGLQAQIPVMLGAGYSGVAYMSSDLGGFAGGEKNPELYTRWLQYGAFNPIMRAHGAGGIPSEPIYYDERTQNIVRAYIKLRYSFLPYNYTLAWHNATTGTPLSRPVWYHDPASLATYQREDEFMWGEQVLVAPVLEANQRAREVYLPAGTWVNWWTGESHAGSNTISVEAPLEVMPLFVRAGAVLPTTSQDLLTTDAYTGTELTVHVFPAASLSGEMYHDDGTAGAYARGDYEQLVWGGSHQGNTLTVEALRSHSWSGAPAQRTLTFVVHGQAKAPASVQWGDATLTKKSGTGAPAVGTWKYSEATEQLWVTVAWQHQAQALIIQ